MDILFARRSIRKFVEGEISSQQVEELLRAAMVAPSAGNAQPWHFMVIRDRGMLERIPDIHPNASMACDAQLAIMVCADPSLEKYSGRWPLDCSAATQNILLAATSMGLGSVWVGVYPDEQRMDQMRELCGIPATISPFALIPIGQPGEQKPPNDRYLPERVHHDRW